MKTQKGKLAISIILVLTVFVAFAVAGGEHKINLMADKSGKGAKGEVVFADKGADQKEITITMKGLKPNSIYTVWLVNMKPKMDMLGVGTGDYSFKSDDKGNGRYNATISKTELDKWQMFKIAYHPDGDPKNMKNIEIVLKSPVK